MSEALWQFWIDRGGTFTDVVGKDPQGKLHIHKLLSHNPSGYDDAAYEGIRRMLPQGAKVQSVKMGTTVATNALLERQGEPTVLLITKGFADALEIGYQNRPHLFKLKIERPQQLYSQVIEVHERLDAHGKVLQPLDEQALTTELERAYKQGFRSCAIVLMHGYRFTHHEQIAGRLAKAAGFNQVSLSHQVNPLMKLVSRGDTTVVDSYLTPILHRYIKQFIAKVGQCSLQFMQSSGGLTEADHFHGKDAVLSGPAGGVVAMVETAAQAGFARIIGLDMGGTSTDVALYDGEYERTLDNEVAGVRIRAPMMKIHTVAAGGGSILDYDGQGKGLRLSVGPGSAGAYPGPLCYGNQGPLTVTDINLLLGKLQADLFPAIFGPNQDEPLDKDAVVAAFAERQQALSSAQGDKSIDTLALAQGYLEIAVAHMANAIKHISVEKGIDCAEFTLCCFGGAGPQHACLIADALGISQIFIHQLGSVLSAYGMGLAKVREIKLKSLELEYRPDNFAVIDHTVDALSAVVQQTLSQQGFSDAQIQRQVSLQLKYAGSDTTLNIQLGDKSAVHRAFEQKHQLRFGFISKDKPLIVESVQVEGIAGSETLLTTAADIKITTPPQPIDHRAVYFERWQTTPFYQRAHLKPGHTITGPAIVVAPQTTIVVEPDWQLTISPQDSVVLQRINRKNQQKPMVGSEVNPIRLELFNNLFMFIAEQMGLVLRNTATSVNIKERLDFSCALFNHRGELVANAPHMPVHLGSMGESITSIAQQNAGQMQPGDVYLINSPFHGGSHLPDLTVATPVFAQDDKTLRYWVASRGHHADIGGLTPGSMPPHSHHIDEEGILFSNFLLVRQGQLQIDALREKLSTPPYPARNIALNIADLKAQIAANQKGIFELMKVERHYGFDVLSAYMDHVIDAAESAVRQAIGQLSSGSFVYPMDDGTQIAVSVTIEKDRAIVDFSGTSTQQDSNFNAPYAVCKAAVLYVFRTLVDKNIPLNAGCLKPITLRVPQGSMLNPSYPAAVVAGNVETSQAITDALYGALKVTAASQGTMNNLTFGNDKYQYYETICGGTGAGPHGPGVDAVQSHMTNSRLTDPEVLEWRYPVTLDNFAIRQGSGGLGENGNGGNGVVRKITFNQAMSGAIVSNHRITAPFGLGGEPGKTGRNYVITAKGQHIELASCDQYDFAAGDSIVIETPGGGGYSKTK